MNDTPESSKEILEDDIVAMLDNFMAKGGGHMNVDVNALSKDLNKQVQETKSSECNSKNMACQVPTLHTGLDAEEE